jgi:hypothetical protein
MLHPKLNGGATRIMTTMSFLPRQIKNSEGIIMKELQANYAMETNSSLPDPLDELQGQVKGDNQKKVALHVVDGGGHMSGDNHSLPAPSLLNLYVTLFEDAQQERLVILNQMRCYLRDSIPKEEWPCKDADKSFNDAVVMESELLPVDLRNLLHEIVIPKEKSTKKMMEREVKKHPLWPYLESIRGMGPTLAARLLHRIGNRHFPSPAHLWSYAGLDGPGWRKNSHNWALTAICFNIADCFQRQPLLSGGYRDIYDARKEYETTKPPCEKCKEQGFEDKCRPAHVNNKSRRYAVKMFLKDLWVEMQGHMNSETHDGSALH